MKAQNRFDFIRSAIWHQDDCGSGWGNACTCRCDKALAYLDAIEAEQDIGICANQTSKEEL